MSPAFEFEHVSAGYNRTRTTDNDKNKIGERFFGIAVDINIGKDKNAFV